MTQRRYRGLLVDFGGVLTTDFFAPFETFCRRHDLPPSTIYDLMSSDPDGRELWHQVERGEISQPEFESRLARMLNIEPDGLVIALLADLRPDDLMLDAVRAAQRVGVRAGVVTNSWGTDPYDPYALWELDAAFDAVVVSHEVGLRKPDPAMYLLAAEKVSVAPENCIFIDDVEGNLPTAEALGMAVIHHVDTEATIRTLEQLLGVALRPASDDASSQASFGRR